MEELRTHVREQRREQERQKAIEAEARSVERTLKEQDVQQASTSHVHRPLGSSVRKDSSPVKVRSFGCLSCVLGALTGIVDSLYLEYSTRTFYCRNPTQRHKSLPYGQPSTPRARAALAAVSSARPFRARLTTRC